VNHNGHQGELFAIFWHRPQHPFRLRVNDLIRVNGRLGRVIRVTECAAVLLVNQPRRVFKTRFDKPVNFQPPPSITRMSANAEIEILNRRRPKQKLARKEA
jgi:hypothetical protein